MEDTRELAETYFDVARIERNLDGILEGASGARDTAAKRGNFRQLMVSAIAATYDADELIAAIEFFGSDLGQAYLSKNAQIGERLKSAIMTVLTGDTDTTEGG